MKTTIQKFSLLTTSLAAGLLLAASPANAANFPGNGNGGFGGAVGNGTLSVTDDGTNITFTLLRGGGTLNDVLAIYIDTGVGGYMDTSTFTATGGGDVNGISGYNGSSRSVMTFTNGFRPSYAIAIKSDYMDLFSLANPASFSYITGAGQSGSSSASFSLTINCANLGLATNTPASFRLFGTYLSSTAYRSTEAIAGNDFSSFGQGSHLFTQTAYATYNFAAPPAPSYPVKFSVDMNAQIALGPTVFDPTLDTVYTAGTFQTNAWSGFQLTETTLGSGIYEGTYLDYNPTNTAELFKFKFHHAATTSDTIEGVDNRPFTLKAPGVTNALVYFDDVYPSPSATTNYLTFSIDMGPQIYLGHFNPGADQIQLLGTMGSPKWTAGIIVLTNNPTLTGNASNIYTSPVIADGNYPGSYENYKFVIVSGSNTYESGNNRKFFTPANSYTFPLAYFNGVSNIYATPVTFQVDMTAPIAAGTFNYANNDTVSAAGTFQTNTWTAGIFILTNNPSAANTNIFTGTYLDHNAPGSGELFKFQINPAGNSASANWETIGNRTFLLGSTALTNPVVYWNNLDPANVLLVPTLVTFTVDMTGAVDIFGFPFVIGNNDKVVINGDFTNPQWPDFWKDALLGGINYSQNLLSTSDNIHYTGTFTVPAGNSLQVHYKYGIIHSYTGTANTNADNEASVGLDHTRYIRATGTYQFPTDIFGIQRTNLPAATEPSFGNLAIGRPIARQLPITWLGRPGVHLQYKANLTSGAWLDWAATDGMSSTNWPPTNAATFFRLVNP